MVRNLTFDFDLYLIKKTPSFEKMDVYSYDKTSLWIRKDLFQILIRQGKSNLLPFVPC